MEITKEHARAFAEEWMQAWNSHDLDAIMAHYAEDLHFYSPIIRQLQVNEAGLLEDKASLRAYFEKALQLYPNLLFKMKGVFTGVDSVVLYYTTIQDREAAEFMQFDASGKVKLVRAHYS